MNKNIEDEINYDLSTDGMSRNEEIQRIKAEIWASDYIPEDLRQNKRNALKVMRALPVIVAEGDSWFDYAPGVDVLDQLRRIWGYRIHKQSEGGDTLENMVYGTKIKRNFTREASGLHFVLQDVAKYKPKVVLFSAGGNDVAGDELMTYLNHIWSPASSGGKKWLREDAWKSALAQMESHIRVFAKEVWKIDKNVHIAMHGYGRPVPDGRAVFNAPFGFKFVGPWIRPAFAKKGYTDWKATTPWVSRLLDEYNDLLAGISTSLGSKFHYVDTRPLVGSNDWANELHPTNQGFEKVARKIHEQVLSQL